MQIFASRHPGSCGRGLFGYTLQLSAGFVQPGVLFPDPSLSMPAHGSVLDPTSLQNPD